MVCIAMIAVTFIPVSLMMDQLRGAYHRSLAETMARSDCERIGYRVQSLLRQGDFKIASDNRGATMKRGVLSWKDGELRFQGRLPKDRWTEKADHFSLHRDQGVTFITLVRHQASTGRSHRFLFRVEREDGK